MCGLFGGISSTLTQGELNFIFGLSTLSVFRGTDSSGMAVMLNAGNKAKEDLLLFKDLVLAPELYSRVIHGNRVFNKPDQSVKMVLGHARAATKGIVDRNNAHPFNFSNVVGTHNGTCHNMVPHDLSDADKMTQKANDSWQIYNMLNHKPLDEVLDRIRWGAFALAWVDKRDRTLNFIRNTERPLAFGSTGGTLYWASEPEFLAMVRTRMRFGINIVEAEPGVHYSLPLAFTSIKAMKETDKSDILRPKPVVAFHKGSAIMDEGPDGEAADLLEAMGERASFPTSVPSFLQKPEAKAAAKEPGDESRVNSCRVLKSGEVIEKCSFENAKTAPLVDKDKVLDFFRVIDSTAAIVDEPADEDIHEVLHVCNNDGCIFCGNETVKYEEVTRCIFYTKDASDYKGYSMVCPNCVKENTSHFIGYEVDAVQIVPKYWKGTTNAC